jgi:hypothetical protein
MKRVFILGAGASKFAGYPLGPELWSFIKEHADGDFFAQKRRDEVVQLVDKIVRNYAPPDQYDRPNLEEIFTYLDLATLGSSLLELSGTDWEESRLKVMAVIADAFQWYQYSVKERLLKVDGIRTTLNCWTDFLKKDDVIITFNWDLLHEAALFRANKWHYSDGYGFNCEDSPRAVNSPILMLKLHGSVNWAQTDERDCQPAIQFKADFFPPSTDDHAKTYLGIGVGPNEGRYLIIPSYLKDLSANKLSLSLWNRAQDAVAEADEVIVIGYSLHPADAPSRQLFGSALLRNKKISKVFYVRPSSGPDYWDEFCDSVGKYRKPIHERFEDWITNPIIPYD